MIDRLLSRGNRLVRPQDASGMVRNPSKEFTRLEDKGVLLHVARGYYVIVPEVHRAGFWRPTIEGIALGMAVADYGRDGAALMGVSAARLLGAMPRAVAAGVVASSHQRPTRDLDVGRILFVKREVEVLDAQLVKTDIVDGLCATVEQTALDIADRPQLGGITTGAATDVLLSLAGRVDWGPLIDLSTRQRKIAALARFAWVASSVVDPPDLPRPRAAISAKGLRPSGGSEASRFGIEL